VLLFSSVIFSKVSVFGQCGQLGKKKNPNVFSKQKHKHTAVGKHSNARVA